MINISPNIKTDNPYKSWLVFANRKKCRHADALHNLGFINWTMHRTNFSIGDIVYLFLSDERRIGFKTIVSEKNCRRQDYEYWTIATSNNLTYKLQLQGEFFGKELNEEFLEKYGFKGGKSLQHPIYNKPELFNYIESVFSKNSFDYDFLPDSNSIFEGAKKSVIVNQYERNPIARQKCIETNGCKCKVCGMDFEEKYGEIGRGFIHVHHVVPISTIGESYQIDPIKDLVPVCPNCHAMLHRGLNGITLTVDELKALIQK